MRRTVLSVSDSTGRRRAFARARSNVGGAWARVRAGAPWSPGAEPSVPCGTTVQDIASGVAVTLSDWFVAVPGENIAEAFATGTIRALGASPPLFADGFEPS
jgi:hypothetical protein